MSGTTDSSNCGLFRSIQALVHRLLKSPHDLIYINKLNLKKEPLKKKYKNDIAIIMGYFCANLYSTMLLCPRIIGQLLASSNAFIPQTVATIYFNTSNVSTLNRDQKNEELRTNPK